MALVFSELKTSCGNNKMVYNGRTNGHGTALGIKGVQNKRDRGTLGFTDHSWGRAKRTESSRRSGHSDLGKSFGHTDQWSQQEGVPAPLHSSQCKRQQGLNGARGGRPGMPCKEGFWSFSSWVMWSHGGLGNQVRSMTNNRNGENRLPGGFLCHC